MSKARHRFNAPSDRAIAKDQKVNLLMNLLTMTVGDTGIPVLNDVQRRDATNEVLIVLGVYDGFEMPSEEVETAPEEPKEELEEVHG